MEVVLVILQIWIRVKRNEQYLQNSPMNSTNSFYNDSNKQKQINLIVNIFNSLTYNIYRLKSSKTIASANFQSNSDGPILYHYSPAAMIRNAKIWNIFYYLHFSEH